MNNIEGCSGYFDRMELKIPSKTLNLPQNDKSFMLDFVQTLTRVIIPCVTSFICCPTVIGKYLE